MPGYALIYQGETRALSNDWSTEAEDAGSPSDTIEASTWAIAPQDEGSPTAPLLTGEGTAGAVTRVRVSGCAAGRVYRLVNSVTWASGAPAQGKKVIVLRCENPAV